MTRVIKGGGRVSALTATDGRAAAGEPIHEHGRLLAEARVEAEGIRRAAQADAERLRREAVAEGRERGLSAVTELLASARALAQRARREADEDLRRLAVRIAEKLLGRELELSPDAVTDVAAQALQQAGAARQLIVRAHPDDVEALERGKPRLIERARAQAQVSVRADASVERGGCIVESELGVVDARLSTQLDAIERALKGSG